MITIFSSVDPVERCRNKKWGARAKRKQTESRWWKEIDDYNNKCECVLLCTLPAARSLPVVGKNEQLPSHSTLINFIHITWRVHGKTLFLSIVLSLVAYLSAFSRAFALQGDLATRETRIICVMYVPRCTPPVVAPLPIKRRNRDSNSLRRRHTLCKRMVQDFRKEETQKKEREREKKRFVIVHDDPWS